MVTQLCSACGSEDVDHKPCEGCPRAACVDVLNDPSVGPIVASVMDLDFMLQSGIRIGSDEIDVIEFAGLKAIRQERDRAQRIQAARERERQKLTSNGRPA